MSLHLSRRQALSSVAAVGALSAPSLAWSRDAQSDNAALAEAVDAYVKRAMAAFPDQPAVSVALVKEGQTLLARGYGVRRMGHAETVNEHTLFAIASNTKSVTAAALAILVDEGKVKWDEPVRTYLPGFTLSDPYIGEHITVRDTLSHRAGFGLGAGDLLFWPNSDRTREEVLRQAAFVPIEDGFRANYHYCNLMFVVAGAVLEAVSGTTWEDFIQTRIFNPLGMTETVPMTTRADPAKSALPHARVGPPLRTHGPMVQIADSIAEVWNWDSAAAAGGICTTPVDWAKWMQMRLAMGVLPDGTRLFSEAVAKEMWRPNIIVSGTEGPTASMPGRAGPSAPPTPWAIRSRTIAANATSAMAAVRPAGSRRPCCCRAARSGFRSSPMPRKASYCGRCGPASPTSAWGRRAMGPTSTGSRIRCDWPPRPSPRPSRPPPGSTPNRRPAPSPPSLCRPMPGPGAIPGTATS